MSKLGVINIKVERYDERKIKRLVAMTKMTIIERSDTMYCILTLSDHISISFTFHSRFNFYVLML